MLVQNSDLDFWSKGRFLVRTDSKLVSYNEGTHTTAIYSALFFCLFPAPLRALLESFSYELFLSHHFS
jgi:hypothetical protein